MDFITGLTPSYGRDVIFVVVDRSSKNAHFLSLKHPYTTMEVSQVYLDHVLKLHGWRRSIVFDRNSIFLVNFGRPCSPCRAQLLQFFLAYHLQTNG